MRFRTPVIVAIAFLAGIGSSVLAQTAGSTVTLQPGESITIVAADAPPPPDTTTPPPDTTVPPPDTTVPPPDTTVPPPDTTVPPSSDPTVTFDAVAYQVPDKRAATRRGQIGFSVICPYTHSAKDDPIVKFGQPGAAHLHDFFGAREVDAFTTVAELQHMPNSCATSNDRSAYWAPAVYLNGVKAKPGNVTFYYKPQVDPRTAVQPIPFGLQMIAGNANATEMQNPLHFWFQEGNNASVNSSNGVVPRNPQLRITYPDCWDGQRLTSTDQSHMTYSRSRSCPSSHPVPILQLTMFVQYPDGTNLTLASGSWITMHADFINAWHPDTLRALIDECIVPYVRCGRVLDS